MEFCGHGEEDVAQCAASDGGDESDNIGAEPVEIFGGGQTYARYGEGDGADYLYRENENVAFIHGVNR